MLPPAYKVLFSVIKRRRLLEISLSSWRTKRTPMKIPFRAIAFLIIFTLTGVFAYQAYWLVGLYQSMKKDMDNCLLETLQLKLLKS